MPDTSQVLSEARRAYLIAPAGCGKTEVIADAVARSTGRQLILTHTHAGVDSLKARLRKKGVHSRRCHVDTIASWALRYAYSYPGLSGLTQDPSLITGKGWEQVYECANALLAHPVAQEVVRSSYDGIYVDEYQDCNVRHHKIVMGLADLMPCRLLGDPLQGIFDFAGDLIDWDADIDRHFERLPDIVIPWRWASGNEALGEWLLSIRETLQAGGSIDLRNAPECVRWMQHDPTRIMDVPNHCQRQVELEGSLVVIHRFPKLCHDLAKQLGGQYQSMDEMAANDLMRYAEALDKTRGGEIASLLIKFAADCMIGINVHLGDLRDRYHSGRHPTQGQRASFPIVTGMLDAVLALPSPQAMLAALDAIRKECADCKMYRQELWGEMRRALASNAESLATLRESAWIVRNRTRIAGRLMPRRTVSRTLLIKGLEFDHATVLEADRLDYKNLYVALTRAKCTVTVWSRNPILQPETLR